MGWALDEWDKMGTATMVAHLLECGTHATGGNYVDPPYRVLDDIVHLGFPLAHVSDDELIITKLEGTGGAVDIGTMKTQLAYEIHDPAAYLTPDSTADFSHVWVEEIGPDRVRVGGATGRPRPDKLKVLVGVDEGWKVVTEISYGGPGCVERAQLGAEVVAKRLEPFQSGIDEIRYDFHGMSALFEGQVPGGDPAEVRLRVAARCDDRETADAVAFEGQFLWMGPAGGGGGHHSDGSGHRGHPRAVAPRGCEADYRGDRRMKLREFAYSRSRRQGRYSQPLRLCLRRRQLGCAAA